MLFYSNMNIPESTDREMNNSESPEYRTDSAALRLLAKIIARNLVKRNSAVEHKAYLKTDHLPTSRDDHESLS